MVNLRGPTFGAFVGYN